VSGPGWLLRVLGGLPKPTKKPDPEGALQLMREASVRPRETVIVGDSGIDVLTGRNAGAWTCGVAYGFAPHTLQAPAPDLLVQSPQELASALA